MPSYYDKLKSQYGEAVAKLYMKSLRARVKKQTGFGILPPEERKALAKKAAMARWHKYGTPQEKDPPTTS